MSRSGYVEACGDKWDIIRWRGTVARAIKGRRGQLLLRELLDALVAMPDKRLTADSLVDAEGEVCALGCLGRVRGVDLASLDPEDPEQVAKVFGVSPILVREIVYENDEGGWRENDAQRWQRMLKWVASKIVVDAKTAKDRA